MQTHQLAAKIAVKSRKRVGRGGKRGTYSGHGGKGQTARSGRNFRPIIRDVLKRYPKLRGYKNHRVGVKAEIVNIKELESKFENGQKVNPRTLVEMNLAPRVSGRYPEIKILGTGEITKNLIVEDCEVSKSAKEKIEKAGGSVKN
ncbi:MAG: uL15 family ribosomal protein [Candidatus Nealsonbacteria bacterium DGGOD1a]|jgi:large subunit ribosomal protein L15|nr:MAG: uL15 family ribosomal protein [Candidatus Nealsonbacteria bacterium DGGOD1a]